MVHEVSSKINNFFLRFVLSFFFTLRQLFWSVFVFMCKIIVLRTSICSMQHYNLYNFLNKSTTQLKYTPPRIYNFSVRQNNNNKNTDAKLFTQSYYKILAKSQHSTNNGKKLFFLPWLSIFHYNSFRMKYIVYCMGNQLCMLEIC